MFTSVIGRDLNHYIYIFIYIYVEMKLGDVLIYISVPNLYGYTSLGLF